MKGGVIMQKTRNMIKSIALIIISIMMFNCNICANAAVNDDYGIQPLYTTIATNKTLNFFEVIKRKKKEIEDTLAAVYILEMYMNKNKCYLLSLKKKR